MLSGITTVIRLNSEWLVCIPEALFVGTFVIDLFWFFVDVYFKKGSHSHADLELITLLLQPPKC